MFVLNKYVTHPEEHIGILIGLVISPIVILQYVSWRRLSQFNGPFMASISKLWIIKCTWQQNLHLELKRLCDQYGKAVRISPNDIVTDDLDHVLKMSAVRSTYTRSDVYSSTAFDWQVNHVFSERNEARHNELRAKLASGYSGKENLFLEHSVNTQIVALMTLIDQQYTSSPVDYRPTDFSRLGQFFTLDVITAIAFGEPIGFLSENEDIDGYCHVSHQILPLFEWLGVYPSIDRIIRWPVVRNFVMPSANDATGVGSIMRLARRVVKKRYESEKDPKHDMLGAFIKKGLKQREAETETALQIMAGSDTTVTSIRSALLFIITHPQVHATLRAELDDAYSRGEFDDPVISDSQALRLPYFQACIRESLRMIPPVFGMLQKLVPPEGDTIDGKYLPPGTRVGTCIYGILRNKKTFGDDADLYRPERWLREDDARLSQMIKAGEIMFGSGKYSCLGKTVAMFEIRKTIATLIRRYDITLQDVTKPWTMRPANGLFLQDDMWVKIQKRT